MCVCVVYVWCACMWVCRVVCIGVRVPVAYVCVCGICVVCMHVGMSCSVWCVYVCCVCLHLASMCECDTVRNKTVLSHY